MKNKDPQQELNDDESQIEERAVGLLSRREHSYVELKRKLIQKGFESDAVLRVLNKLQERGWQSDQRFSEGFVRQRIMQRRGPLKIKSDLMQKGIHSSQMEEAMSVEDVDWKTLAVETLVRKFREPAKGDLKALAKRQRFLASRGFLPDHIRYAIDVTESDDWDWEHAIF
ncbi:MULTISPECIES: regulatory protein RecX [Gammaproteobacteria]|uniref:regulatory protein RecX n=1 Tax=Gammaproteobacteria TaxID=1236 RepID=UPI000DCF98B2|nr:MULTISPECIES: regulatory protein RecX [Gammaproteobacteria]RTE87562.1 regulatory protein RecX [Aliidiomarina sp. B3213]TCZ92654.1 regulatory protein RecX [Lysobacter sp. N42]